MDIFQQKRSERSEMSINAVKLRFTVNNHSNDFHFDVYLAPMPKHQRKLIICFHNFLSRVT